MVKIKIKNKIKEAKQVPDLNYGIFIDNSSKKFSLYLLDLSALSQRINEYKELNSKTDVDAAPFFKNYVKNKEGENDDSASVIGFIDAEEDNNRQEPCMNAIKIAYTAVHEKRSGQGFAKLMYKLALAFASKKGKPMMPDRLHVEPAAANIWKSLEKDPSVSKSFDSQGYALSDQGNRHDEVVASYFDVEQPRKTKMRFDDCRATSEEPYGSTLNRAYYSTEMLSKLEEYTNNFNQFVSENFSSTSGLKDGLYTVSHSMFKRRFN